MKKILSLICFIICFVNVAYPQNPQSQTAPISAINAKYSNGISNGYVISNTNNGLTITIGPGTVFCSGNLIEFAGGNLNLTPSATNYVYLNTASSCAPTSKTTALTVSDIPLAKIVTSSSSVIIPIDDYRTEFIFSPGLNSSDISAFNVPVATGPNTLVNSPCNWDSTILATFTCTATTEIILNTPNVTINGTAGTGSGVALTPGTPPSQTGSAPCASEDCLYADTNLGITSLSQFTVEGNLLLYQECTATSGANCYSYPLMLHASGYNAGLKITTISSGSGYASGQVYTCTVTGGTYSVGPATCAAVGSVFGGLNVTVPFPGVYSVAPTVSITGTPGSGWSGTVSVAPVAQPSPWGLQTGFSAGAADIADNVLTFIDSSSPATAGGAKVQFLRYPLQGIGSGVQLNLPPIDITGVALTTEDYTEVTSANSNFIHPNISGSSTYGMITGPVTNGDCPVLQNVAGVVSLVDSTAPCGGGGGGGVSSVTNSDGTLLISPTVGGVVASLSLGHTNTWTGTQTVPLGSASTAVTQSPGDNTTKVATDAFVLANGGVQYNPATTKYVFDGDSRFIVSSSCIIGGVTSVVNYTTGSVSGTTFTGSGTNGQTSGNYITFSGFTSGASVLNGVIGIVQSGTTGSSVVATLPSALYSGSTGTGSSDCTYNVPQQASKLAFFNGHGNVYNVAVGGSTTANSISTYSTNVHPLSPAVTGDPIAFYIYDGSANDVLGIGPICNAATTEANLQQLWSMAHTDGFTVLETGIIQTNVGITCGVGSAIINEVNAWVIAQGKSSTTVGQGSDCPTGYPNCYWDRFADLGDYFQNPSNSILFIQSGSDAGHLTDKGAWIAANIINESMAAQSTSYFDSEAYWQLSSGVLGTSVGSVEITPPSANQPALLVQNASSDPYSTLGTVTIESPGANLLLEDNSSGSTSEFLMGVGHTGTYGINDFVSHALNGNGHSGIGVENYEADYWNGSDYVLQKMNTVIDCWGAGGTSGLSPCDVGLTRDASISGQLDLGNGSFNNVSGILDLAVLKLATTQSTVSCSTSGNVVFSQPLQGSSDKKVLINLNACLGTASYTFPTPFTSTPDYFIGITASGASLTSLSTTAVTISGTTSSGLIILEGY